MSYVYAYTQITDSSLQRKSKSEKPKHSNLMRRPVHCTIDSNSALQALCRKKSYKEASNICFKNRLNCPGCFTHGQGRSRLFCLIQFDIWPRAINPDPSLPRISAFPYTGCESHGLVIEHLQGYISKSAWDIVFRLM